MGNVLNNWVSSEILAEKRVGRTSVIFTKKALTHVLEQHSEEKGTEKARMLKKICFPWTVEVDKMGREIVEKLPDELERYRRNRQRLTEDSRKSLISHIYICLGVRSGLCNWSFYSQIFLKLFPFTKKDNKVWFLVFFHIFLCLMPWYLKFFHWGRLGVLGVLVGLDIERGASELLFVLFRERSCLWESR